MPDSLRKRLREVRNLIQNSGGAVNDVAYGKHCKVTFTTPRGETRVLIMSSTSSDWRHSRQTEMQIRKLMV